MRKFINYTIRVERVYSAIVNPVIRGVGISAITIYGISSITQTQPILPLSTPFIGYICTWIGLICLFIIVVKLLIATVFSRNT